VIFNLFAIEGYGHKEIAEMLNIAEGTSKSQYARAKSLLQAKILRESNYHQRYGESKV
jgi:RNA polymerase sigma-70 factor (ECF subfamily)